MRLLAKDPADRPESAEVVVKEIRTIERELACRAAKGGTRRRPRRLTVVVGSTRRSSGRDRRGNEPDPTGADAVKLAGARSGSRRPCWRRSRPRRSWSFVFAPPRTEQGRDRRRRAHVSPGP